jgi:hypothetical protein
MLMTAQRQVGVPSSKEEKCATPPVVTTQPQTMNCLYRFILPIRTPETNDAGPTVKTRVKSAVAPCSAEYLLTAMKYIG